MTGPAQAGGDRPGDDDRYPPYAEAVLWFEHGFGHLAYQLADDDFDDPEVQRHALPIVRVALAGTRPNGGPLAEIEELARDAVTERANASRGGGNRTGDELHELDGAAELAESVLRVLAASRPAAPEGGGAGSFRARVVEALGFDVQPGDDDSVIADIGERVAQADHCLTRHAHVRGCSGDDVPAPTPTADTGQAGHVPADVSALRLALDHHRGQLAAVMRVLAEHGVRPPEDDDGLTTPAELVATALAAFPDETVGPADRGDRT